MDIVLNGVVGCLHKHPTFVIKKGELEWKTTVYKKN